MIRMLVRATVLLMLALVKVQAAPQRIVFEGNQSEHKRALKELNPQVPSDRTGHDDRVLEMKAAWRSSTRPSNGTIPTI
jgi:hypothetical protein